MPFVNASELSELYFDKNIELQEDDDLDEVFSEWDDHVNMTASELERWSNNPCSREASRDPEAVIKRNLRLLEKNKDEWTDEDIKDAKRTISFISRMKANEPDEPREGPHGCPSKWAISLLNWAFNPFDSLPEIPEDDDLEDVDKISMQEFEFEEGDEVTWESSGGQAFGVVRDRTNDSCYDAAIDGDVKVCGEEDNPAYLIEVYDDEEEELTGTMVGHKEDTLDAANVEVNQELDIGSGSDKRVANYEYQPVPDQVLYETRELAEQRAANMGMERGAHEHVLVSGDEEVTMYMPGETHAEWANHVNHPRQLESKENEEEVSMRVNLGQIYEAEDENANKVFDSKKIEEAMEKQDKEEPNSERLLPTVVENQGDVEQEGGDFFRANWPDLFLEEGRDFVFQMHWMGLSEEQKDMTHEGLLDEGDVRVHGDLRMAIDSNNSFGITSFEDEDEILVQDASELVEASKNMNPNEDRLSGIWKSKHPSMWMDFGFDEPLTFEPGEEGATENTFGKVFGIDRGSWTPGVVHRNAVELFLDGEEINGRMMMTFIPQPGDRKDRWSIFFPSNQDPIAEQKSIERKVRELRNAETEHSTMIWNNPDDDKQPRKINISTFNLSEDNLEEITVEEMDALWS